MIFAITAAALLVGMALLLCRALLGPNAYDRVLALNSFGTKTVVLIAVLGFLNGRPEFLDLALVYALINFIGTIAVLKYIEYGDLGAGSRPSGPGGDSAGARGGAWSSTSGEAAASAPATEGTDG